MRNQPEETRHEYIDRVFDEYKPMFHQIFKEWPKGAKAARVSLALMLENFTNGNEDISHDTGEHRFLLEMGEYMNEADNSNIIDAFDDAWERLRNVVHGYDVKYPSFIK